MTNSETTSQEIKRKMQFTGKVVKTTLAGAIIDIGQEKPGVVHIAHMSDDSVKRVEDVVTVGQEVEVWVRRAKHDSNHIELTMIEPLALEWRDIKKEMVVQGTVVRLEKFGAFIEIGAERPGLAHISELTHDYIRRPEDAVQVGEEVEAKVIDFSRRKKQIKLSLKALAVIPQEALEMEAESEPVLTAMEMAYRRALDGEESVSDKEDKKKLSKLPDEQDNIISRTLEQKAKTK